MISQFKHYQFHNIQQLPPLSMFVDLGNDWRFPIPFQTIYSAQRLAIQRIHYHRTLQENSSHSHSQNNSQAYKKHLVGELKLSDRQTIIILCYLLTAMASPKSISDHIPQTVFYLCKSEERKQWLLKAIDKTMIFLDNQLSRIEQPIFSIKDIKVYQLSDDLQRTIEKDKATNNKLRRLFVMPFSRYMGLKLQIKQLNYWQHNTDPSIELKQNANVFLFKYCKNVDYLFAQTNDLEGVLEDTLSVSLSQTIVYRAWMQLMKLNKFYNFRLQKNRQKGKSIKKIHTRQNEPLKNKSFQQKLQIKEETKKENLQSSNLNSGNNGLMREKQKKMQVEPSKQLIHRWSLQKLDSQFSQLANLKQKELQPITQDLYARKDRIFPKYSQCHYLLQLQAITHLVSFLVSTYKEKEADAPELQQSTQQYIVLVCKKVNIPSAIFRKYRRILKTFLSKFPPKVKDRQIPIYYLQQVLKFFEKLVVWHDIFNKIFPDEIHPGSLTNKFWVFKYKHEIQVQLPMKDGNYCKKVREIQLRLATFDQRIMFQLLCDGVKSFCSHQNQAYQYGYYEQVFKPKKLINLGIEYRCPRAASKETKCATVGLIINSTPNDQNLHIMSDQTHFSLQQNETEDYHYDRENYSQIIRAYGVLIHDLCQTVPDGVIVYFPTRQILRECRGQWQSKQNIYERIYQKKRVFQEDQSTVKNADNLKLFKKFCDNGRGAVFLISAHSQFSKNETFFGHYSKCVVFVGVPYNPVTSELQIKARQVKQKELFHFEAGMRVVSRCLSNCINNPDEMRVVIFADASFGNFDIRKKWFPFIEKGNLNTLDVIQTVKKISSKTYQTIVLGKKLEQHTISKQGYSHRQS